MERDYELGLLEQIEKLTRAKRKYYKQIQTLKEMFEIEKELCQKLIKENSMLHAELLKRNG